MWPSAALLCCVCISCAHALSNHPILVVVSYDAFRYDFFEQRLPHMEQVRAQGVYAEYLINVFPTKTFPNHHSISTGLYTEVHGVIGNSFYDSALKNVVGMGFEMYHYNDDVKPIWRLNEDLGEGRHSGAVMWPGSNFPYQNKTITWTLPFEAGYDWQKRVDHAISWILDPFRPANLVMLYFEEPDTHGHAFGPNSEVVRTQVHKLDNITGYLHEQLHAHGLSDLVNVIHVSDHGMTAVTPPRFINITQYMQNGTYEWAGASPAIQITPHQGEDEQRHEQEIYSGLKAASRQNGHFGVYNKSEYLERWHYKNNSRSPPILVLADVGYALDDLIRAAPRFAEKYNFTLTNSSEFGVHGYDYTETQMHPFFMAVGPQIRQHTKVEPFHTVDLFYLFCAILDLPAPANNGSIIPTQLVLQPMPGRFRVGTIVMISGGVLLVLILVILTVVFTLMLIKRQQNITTTAALNKRFPQTFQNYIEAQHLLEPEDA
ncbi:hypothetical protein HUJ04_008705 [Dendroctonus ponderosae]|nr:hypothetical protein HUJ04_008705 [Dendroctonus ponderosae]